MEASLSQLPETFFKQSFDVIVIGSGISGLTSANLLAHHGKKVLVLEMHGKLGGMTHTFRRKGQRFDVGVHYIGEVHRERSILKSLFHFLSEGNIRWGSMGDVYDVIKLEGKTYPFHRDREKFVDELAKKFPHLPDAHQILERYVQDMYQLSASAQSYYIDKTMPAWLSATLGKLLTFSFRKKIALTTDEYLKKTIKDPTMRAVLTGQFGDYGVAPSKSSILIHAMIVKHYLHGAAYPEGGSKVFADYIKKRVLDKGGAFVTKASVKKILAHKNKTVGVELTDGQTFLAPQVITSIGLKRSAALHPTLQNYYSAPLKALSMGPSHLCLYLVTKKPLRALNLPTANLWDYPSQEIDRAIAEFENLSEAEILKADQLKFPLLYYSFTSSKDPEHDHGEHGFMEVITLASFSWFQKWQESNKKNRPADYLQFKEKLRALLERAVLQEFPALENQILHSELSTPLTTKHYCGYEQGEIYGLNHTPDRFLERKLRPGTPLKGTFLTGQDVVSVGIGGALFSGVLTASKMLKKNVLKEIIAKD